MNKLLIIGNLTRDPEVQEVNGTTCCNFTVAVNRRVKPGAHPQADFIRVTAWRQLGDVCADYLGKGRKVMVEGPVRCYAYTSQQGDPKGRLELTATDVEFLTPRGQQDQEAAAADGYADGEDIDDEELPF